MEIIKDMLSAYKPEYLQTIIISIVISVISRVFLALAVHYHSKINHIKYGNLWTSASFLFSGIIIVIYFVFNKRLPREVPIVCTSCGKKPPKGRKKCPHCGGTHFAPAQYDNIGGIKNKIIVFLAIGVALIAAGYWFTNYSPMALPDDRSEMLADISDTEFIEHYGFEPSAPSLDDYIYYDMKGAEYRENLGVPYYDKDGNKYFYDVDGLVCEETGVTVPHNMALVDNEGYLAVGQFDTVPELVPFKTQDGKTYYRAKDVSWDRDGNLIYSSNGEKVAE